MKQFQDLVALAPWTAISMLCNLLILTLLVKKFLFKPVQKIIAERQAAADALTNDAEAAKQRALELQAQYEQSLAGAKEQAAQIVEQAGKNAEAHSEELLAEARETARRMKARAEAEIEQERKKTINEVKDEIGGMAMEIASKVVEREIKEEDHRELIEEFIKNVGDAS